MKSKSRVFTILTLAMMLALFATAFAGPAGAQDNSGLTAEPATAVADSKFQLEAAEAEAINLNEPANYIVQLADPAVASYKGGIVGLSATSPAALGTSKLENTAATQAYVNYLEGVQAAFVNSVSNTLDREVKVLFTYQHAFNGVAVEMTGLEAEQVAQLDGVRLVVRETIEDILTDAGPEWIGAPGVWDGSSVPSGVGTQGEGVVVAILDTGINSMHPSFAAVGGDGYAHTNPLGAGNYLGVCDPTDPDYQADFVCNDKLIGVHDFVDGAGNDPNSPEDGDGHGSHTASTVAGNVVDSTLYAPTIAITETISGVAPHANIIAYDVCLNGPAAEGGGCPGTALLAAVNQAVADSAVLPNGIAALNYSISGGENPYADPVELAFLAATDAGIFVSASAGNSGPGAGTVAHISPWVATIAASTHNRNLLNNLVDMDSDGGPLADIVGKSFSAGYGPAPIVYAGDYPNANDPGGDPAQCLQPYPAGTFNGEIVICDRGTIARVDKGANVLAGGAGGLVLANVAANGNSLNGDGHFLPAVHITYDDGVVLKAWVAANDNTVATITGTIYDLDPANGDIMASFSSRGPAGVLDVLKPDVTAPGVDIWAAVQDDGDAIPDYAFYSGTSMSSPHNAGAAALMTALYPTWTPHQIKSALMTTADTADNFKEDGTTPVDAFDVGAGRIDVSMAAMAGLVMDETTANFENADPANGGDPRTLNIPNFSNRQCVLDCEWTRTVESTLPFTSTWEASYTAPDGSMLTVTPDTFTLPPFGSQEIVVSLENDTAPVDTWLFGEVVLTNTDVEAAFLKVAHLAPFAMDPGTAVTVTLNGAPALTDFAYGDSTTYIPLTPGEYLVEIFPGASPTAAISATVDLMDDTYYTAVAVGDGANQDLELLAFVDDNTAPAAGKFHLRLGHLAPFAAGDATADVRLQDGTPVITDVNYADVTGYLPLDAGAYNLKITTPGGDTTLIDPIEVNFPEGMVVYAFATGEGSNQDLAVFALPTAPDVEGFFVPNQEPYLIYLPVVFQAPGAAATAPAANATGAMPLNVQAVAQGFDLPDTKFPLSVQFTTGSLPDSIDINTRRNAGSQLVEGLEAVEITDFTAEVVGLAQAEMSAFQLFEDPTNGIPGGFFDDLDQVFWMTMTVPADSYSLIAEIVSTTSPDLDMAVGLDTGDGLPEESEIACVSATGGSFEFCEVMEPDAGTWWVVVMNWEESANAPDDVLLATAVVPNSDSGNMTVEGPTTVPSLDPFDIRVFWDTPTMMAGDRWYGAISLGTDAGNPGNIGTIPVYVNRFDDDVVKMADPIVAAEGMTVTYEITVRSNVTTEDLAYILTDTIPVGLTYVPGSAMASFGTVDVTGNVLTWEGTMAVPEPIYMMDTSLNDPSCAVPLANSGAYLNLQPFGVLPQAGIVGDTIWFTAFSTGDPFSYWGGQYTGINFTDDGMAFFGSTPGLTPWVNEDIPNAADPNNLLAFFWNDWEVVYDGPTNRGVSLATLGGTTGGVLIEYDDVQPFGDPSQTIDFEIFQWRTPDMSFGTYDIIFAYDNINLDDPITVGTIGIENALGTDGVKYAYDDAALQTLQDGMAICFDYFVSGDDVTITYQATVDADTDGDTLTNEVVHDTDNPGSQPATTGFDLLVDNDAYLQVAHLAPFAMDPGTAVTITLNGSPALTNFAYGDSTGYIALPYGEYLVEVFPGSSPTAAISATVDLMPGTFYSAVAIGDGLNQDLELLALLDTTAAPAPGFAKLRLGHLAPFAAAINDTLADIRLQDGTPILTDVPFGAVADYLELPAGTYDLKITDPGGAVTLIDPAPVVLPDGAVLSAFATGEGSNQDLAVFAWLHDNPGFFVPNFDASLLYQDMPEIAIPDNGYDGTLGSMACSTVTVAETGTVDNVIVQVAASHTWIGDLTVKLQSPDGSILGLLSRPGLAEPADDGTGCCGDSSDMASILPLVYDDNAVTPAESMGATFAAGFVCLTDGLCSFAPSPDSVAGHASLADFAGETLAGDWTLCMGDSVGGDVGSLDFWTIGFDYTP